MKWKFFFLVGSVTLLSAGYTPLVHAREACFAAFRLLLRWSTLSVAPPSGIILTGQLTKQPRTRCVQASACVLLSSVTKGLCELCANFVFIAASCSTPSAARHAYMSTFSATLLILAELCIVDKFWSIIAFHFLTSFYLLQVTTVVSVSLDWASKRQNVTCWRQCPHNVFRKLLLSCKEITPSVLK